MLHESWSAWKWWTMNFFVGRGWTPISILMIYQKEQFLQVPPLEEVINFVSLFCLLLFLFEFLCVILLW